MGVESRIFTFANKRSRSPSPLPSGRPAKRLYVNAADSEVPQSFAHSPTISLDNASRNASRQPSEDWVRQANDLRIDSPVMVGINDLLSARGTRYPVVDEDAVMDDSSALYNESGENQAIPFDSGMGTQPQQPLLLLQSELASHEASHIIDSSQDEPMPVASPIPSRGQDDVKPKQRLTMGPRADCDKCRLGVKGHWMHLS